MCAHCNTTLLLCRTHGGRRSRKSSGCNELHHADCGTQARVCYACCGVRLPRDVPRQRPYHRGTGTRRCCAYSAQAASDNGCAMNGSSIPRRNNLSAPSVAGRSPSWSMTTCRGSVSPAAPPRATTGSAWQRRAKRSAVDAQREHAAHGPQGGRRDNGALPLPVPFNANLAPSCVTSTRSRREQREMRLTRAQHAAELSCQSCSVPPRA